MNNIRLFIGSFLLVVGSCLVYESISTARSQTMNHSWLYIGSDKDLLGLGFVLICVGVAVVMFKKIFIDK